MFNDACSISKHKVNATDVVEASVSLSFLVCHYLLMPYILLNREETVLVRSLLYHYFITLKFNSLEILGYESLTFTLILVVNQSSQYHLQLFCVDLLLH